MRNSRFHRPRFSVASAAIFVLTLIAGMGVFTAAPTYAQPAAEAPRDVIVVTGTRIARPDANAPSPILSLDRADINQFRETSIEEFLNTLPQVSPDFGRATNNPGNGTASIDLRGLGAGRTLVLLNGRRLAPTGAGSAIDINILPSAIIERAELVTGGASAVYGSDAVTGAVNFMLRDDFEGIELSGQFDIYGAGDGNTWNGSIVAGTGFADERGHVTVFGDFLDRQEIFAGQRDFTSVIFGEDRTAGILFERGSPIESSGWIFTPQALINGQPSQVIFNSDGTVRARDPNTDVFNFAPDNYLQTPLTRWAGGLFARYEATESVELYTELMYARPTAQSQLASAPDFFFAPIVIDSAFFADSARPILSAAFDPDNDGIGQGLIVKRFADVGPRQLRTVRENWRGVFGLRADISSTWSLDAYYSYARNETEEQLGNAVSRSRVLQGLLVDPATGGCVDSSGGCVPVNLFGEGVLTDEARSFISIPNFSNFDESVQHVAAISATGELFTWAGGTARGAGGFEFRRNRGAFIPSEVFQAGDALGFNPNLGIAGAIEVYELFGELVVPLMEGRRFAESLEIEAGGRWSDYSTAGTVWTWKAGSQWRPVDNLRLRTMFQRAVRAPNVGELFRAETGGLASIDSIDDFCAAFNDPVGRGNADICVAQGADPALLAAYAPAPNDPLVLNLITGGNPNLGVEKAFTITAGGEYQFDLPFDLRVSADYFSVEITDAISEVTTPFTQCPFTGDPDGEICGLIDRAPTGEPINGFLRPVNTSVATSKGIDFGLYLDADAPAFMRVSPDATIGVTALATIFFERGLGLAPGSPFIDCAGGFSENCTTSVGLSSSAATTFPDKLFLTTLRYGTGRWTTALRWQRISGLDNLAPVFDTIAGAPPPVLAIPSIGSRNYLDFSVNADIGERVTVRGGVDNILKTDPPNLGDEQSQLNTDPSRYDVFGRRFYVGAELRFGVN